MSWAISESDAYDRYMGYDQPEEEEEGETMTASQYRREFERLMERCVCDWSNSDETRAVNVPPAEGCPSHPAEEEEAA